MNIQTQFKTLLFTVLTAALLFWGCQSSLDSDTDTGTGTMLVKLHDAPVDYDEVNISIERVEVNNSENSDEGWVTISEPNEVYNILDLVNGEFELLANAELEVGTYRQIRLILNNQNTVVIDGETFDLFVPSGVQTGVKLNIDAEIREGIEYTLLLDFDANRSVVKQGSTSQYNLQPVIRATNEAITGNVSGTILQAEARAAVFAISDSDTVSTTFADLESGQFMLVGLPEGSYTVSVEAREDGFESATFNGVEVTLGQSNNLGDVELESSDQ